MKNAWIPVIGLAGLAALFALQSLKVLSYGVSMTEGALTGLHPIAVNIRR